MWATHQHICNLRNVKQMKQKKSHTLDDDFDK